MENVHFYFPLFDHFYIDIYMRWKRFMKYSRGVYQNAGQKLVFRTKLKPSEVIQKLKKYEMDDTLEYEFFEKAGEYFLKIKGVRRMYFRGVLTSVFRVDFVENSQNYIIIQQCNNLQGLYSAGYEAELFEFMVKKINCIPQKADIIITNENISH